MIKVFQAWHEYFSSGEGFDNAGLWTEFGICFASVIGLLMPAEVKQPKNIFQGNARVCGTVKPLGYWKPVLNYIKSPEGYGKWKFFKLTFTALYNIKEDFFLLF